MKNDPFLVEETNSSRFWTHFPLKYEAIQRKSPFSPCAIMPNKNKEHLFWFFFVPLNWPDVR